MIDMIKKEFMDQLREGLDGNVSYEKYCETIEYYESYFRRKLAEGKTEEEIVAELGSGRLIAKTIVDTAGADRTEQSYTYTETTGGRRGSVSRDGEDAPKGWHVKWMKMENRLQLQDVLLMAFQQQASCGEIHYTNGIIINRPTMIGG